MQPHELAIALAELSVAAGTPRRVAIISEAQAEEIREHGYVPHIGACASRPPGAA